VGRLRREGELARKMYHPFRTKTLRAILNSVVKTVFKTRYINCKQEQDRMLACVDREVLQKVVHFYQKHAFSLPTKWISFCVSSFFVIVHLGPKPDYETNIRSLSKYNAID
jgi:hypothetical protein